MWDRERLEKEFKTSIENGLTTDAANTLFKVRGPNCLTDKEKTPAYIMFLKEQTGFFSLLLWFGSALCFVAYAIQESQEDKSNLYLGCVLAFVVFVTGCFSYSQSAKAANLMDDFKNFIPKMCMVMRNGKLEEVEASLLVPGDIVHINQGDLVPADLILHKVTEMKVNNASLTGEAEELLRTTDDADRHENVFESPNVAFFGTSCTSGKGEGLVFRTGDDTAIGRIANLTSSAETKQTPLSHEIERFIILISVVAVFLGVTFFLYGLLIVKYGPVEMLVFAIGIIVANVPEGLLATVTVSLALTAKRMHVKKVLVKNLESVETLGSTSCICSDKTGTLTQNRMTVSHIYLDRQVSNCEVNMETFRKEFAAETEKGKDGRPDSVKKPEYSQDDTLFMTLVQTLALSTMTTFHFEPQPEVIRDFYNRQCKKAGTKPMTMPEDLKTVIDSPAAAVYEQAKADMIQNEKDVRFLKRQTKGDASETGIVRWLTPILMKEYGGPLDMSDSSCKQENALEQMRANYPTLEDADQNPVMIPFNSAIKFNLLIRDMSEGKERTKTNNVNVFLKGAPEKVLRRCTKMLIKNTDGDIVEVDYDESMAEGVEAANSLFGLQGERVLAFARAELDPQDYDKENYVFDVKSWSKWDNQQAQGAGHQNGWFPMNGLTLVGLVSLNDPPRPKVDVSVNICRAAGVKVIMVTGDQPPTAAAIAHKVNIIKNPNLEYQTILDTEMVDGRPITEEEAFEKCNAIVIHGDKLAKVNAAEDALDDDEIEKGRTVMDWIRKEEVVFARTTPSQKLLIVDACQRLGHVVAVTGDGVNDSPAIKQADIGIAMGSGSEVAQNAADMILLDDNFSSIVNGLEEGRLIFDNLKKSIAYTLSSNIPEISPFLFFMMFQIPQPLSTVLILCIDLGTDMIPAISFAYENPELDIMERYPRNSKRDHLVNSKLISFAYLQIGMVQAGAGFFTYFYIMNDYGFSPASLFGLAGEEGIMPNDTDIYTPTESSRGNTNFANGDRDLLDMITAKQSGVDVRLFFVDRDVNQWSECRWMPDADVPHFYKYSHISSNQICWTMEALYYAQCGYLVSIVCVQWSDLLICKTRNLSISQQGMINWNANFALVFETSLVAVLCYVPIINLILGTRFIAFPHFAVPSISFFMVIIFYDEVRKVWLRKGMVHSRSTGRIKFDGWVIRNTYY